MRFESTPKAPGKRMLKSAESHGEGQAWLMANSHGFNVVATVQTLAAWQRFPPHCGTCQLHAFCVDMRQLAYAFLTSDWHSHRGG